MGSKDEWQRYQEALRRGDRAAAAEYLRRYNEAKKAEGSSSKPTIVRLSMRRRGPTAIPLDQLPEEIDRSDDVYELMQRMVEGQ